MTQGDSYINARFSQIVGPQIRLHACKVLLSYLDVAGSGHPISDKAVEFVFHNVWLDEGAYADRIRAIENAARAAGVSPWPWPWPSARPSEPPVGPPAA